MRWEPQASQRPSPTIPPHQPPPPAPPAGAPDKPHHGFGAILTPDEKAQLKKAHDAALAADPTLKTEEDKLASERETIKDASDADKQAYFAEAKAFHEKMKAAELAIDPTLQPIFDKMDKAKQEFKAKHAGAGGDGGSGTPPPPPPAPAPPAGA